MKKSKKLNILGQLMLLSATIVWGSSFVILKQTMETVPAFYIIAVRFLAASLILAVAFFKRFRKIDKKTFFRGVIIGVVVASAYMTQTIGLMYTTPARNAFLTSCYCIMCPFLIWIIYKTKPEIINVVSAVICMVGIGLVALSGSNDESGNYLLGDGLTLACAVFYSLQIVFIDDFQKKGSDSINLLIPELLTVGVIFAISSLVFEMSSGGVAIYALDLNQILKIGYLTLACTLFAQAMQILGQKFTTPAQSSIILTLEAVFGVVFSVILGNEKLSIGLVIGFAVIFIAMLLTELKPDFKKAFKIKKLSVDKNKEQSTNSNEEN